jgi:hypothetical protein
VKKYPDHMRLDANLLRSEGWNARQIGRHLGVSYATIYRWIDPDYEERQRAGARKRKLKYAGTCLTCGRSTTGCYGPKSPEYCRRCWAGSPAGVAAAAGRTKWTREIIIARIQQWNRIYGSPPAINDWNPFGATTALNDHERAARFKNDERWPWFTLVVQRFGTWNAAIEAAGFEGRANHGGGGNVLRRRKIAA